MTREELEQCQDVAQARRAFMTIVGLRKGYPYTYMEKAEVPPPCVTQGGTGGSSGDCRPNKVPKMSGASGSPELATLMADKEPTKKIVGFKKTWNSKPWIAGTTGKARSLSVMMIAAIRHRGHQWGLKYTSEGFVCVEDLRRV